MFQKDSLVIRFIDVANMRIKILWCFQKCWSIANSSAFRTRWRAKRKIWITQYLSYEVKKKNHENTGLFSITGPLLIRLWRFSLNNRPKGAKNTPSFILPQLGLFWKKIFAQKMKHVILNVFTITKLAKCK